MRRILAGALFAASMGGAASARAGQFELVQRGAEWRYLDNGSNQGTAWRAPTFDDSSWAGGAAQLGYGDGDETTQVSYGPNSGSRYITTYFRRHFDVVNASQVARAMVRILRDDGAVVYLNGVEAFRDNMPGGTIGYLTTANSALGGSDEDLFVQHVIDPGLLQTGDNVIAVEIHQSGGTSSDISFDLEVLATDGPAIVTRGPYIQRTSPTAATIRWRTDVASDSRVEFGVAPGSLGQSVSEATSTTEHVVSLANLTPSTRYYYSVGTSAEPLITNDAQFFLTHPTIGADTPVRVWAIGDAGTADLSAQRVRNGYLTFAADESPDVWLLLGDNAYDAGTDPEYQSAVFEMYAGIARQTAAWPTLGNHDATSAVSSSESGVYYDIFTLPRMAESGGLASGTEAYYSFDYGTVHFVCLDSQDSSRSPAGAMLTWLEADLADTTADWIIAYWHHPPYTDGSHDSDDPADSGGRMGDMRQNALPILEAAGVDLVLTGHSHSYERSMLLDGHYGTSNTLTPAMVVDDGDGDETGDGAYRKPTLGLGANEGAVYVVAG
ncbi:MAG: metallophosphoesterase family protein, partial [Phycisphaerales bacterium]|nr:metallophosphoesterase family protein [Phycisphaerales bacterium]